MQQVSKAIKKKIKYNLFVMFCLLIFVVCSSCGKITWGKATKKNTIEAYKQYLASHPQGEFAEKAHDRIENLIDNIIFQGSVEENTDEAYGRYLTIRPNGKFIEKARSLFIDGISHSLRRICIFEDDDDAVEIRKYAEALFEKFDNLTIISLITVMKKDEGLDTQGAAAQALGEIGDIRAVDALTTALKNQHPFVGSNALVALGKIGNASVVDTLITALKGEYGEIDNARREVIEYMGREGVIKSLGEIGDTRAVKPLLEYLTDWYCNQKVAEALSCMSWQPKTSEEKVHLWVAARNDSTLQAYWNLTKTVLLKDVESNQYRTIENALFAFIGIGKEEVLPELVSALNTKGNKTMAVAYLNCGHNELDKAAMVWAARHGYYIESGYGSSPVSWGSM